MMELEFLYMMGNDQPSVISMSITSNIYHFFVFKAFKYLSSYKF